MSARHNLDNARVSTGPRYLVSVDSSSMAIGLGSGAYIIYAAGLGFKTLRLSEHTSYTPITESLNHSVLEGAITRDSLRPPSSNITGVLKISRIS